jgi:hypothetical protein
VPHHLLRQASNPKADHSNVADVGDFALIVASTAFGLLAQLAALLAIAAGAVAWLLRQRPHAERNDVHGGRLLAAIGLAAAGPALVVLAFLASAQEVTTTPRDLVIDALVLIGLVAPVLGLWLWPNRRTTAVAVASGSAVVVVALIGGAVADIASGRDAYFRDGNAALLALALLFVAGLVANRVVARFARGQTGRLRSSAVKPMP